MDIKRTDEKLIKDIEEWNKQEKCIIEDGKTEREKQQEEIIKGQQEKQFAFNFEYALRDNEIDELIKILGEKE